MADDKKFVLLVDDDEKVVKMLEFLLSAKGFMVKSAINGVDALEKLKGKKPDVIILDILMPEMDGLDFMRKIKADHLMKEVPVIVLTAVGFDGSKSQFISLGVSDYFEKPFKSAALVNSVVKVIEEKQA